MKLLEKFGSKNAGSPKIRGSQLYNSEALARQIKLQQDHQWDLEDDIPWGLGVDPHKWMLPLDEYAIAFPGASPEQARALSQWMGLVVNSTISEMEDALPKLRQAGWQRIIQEYPVNPELVELGELFFEEESKHSQAFGRYLAEFCHATNVDQTDLDQLLPKAFGSHFQAAITRNALAGGHAFWWLVASVEEVSIGIFGQIHRHRKNIDPLFYELHRRHLEEEARHANYAFLMLELIRSKPSSMRERLHRKTNYVLSQLAGAPWVVAELYKFYNVRRLVGQHPLFDTLESCIPLFEAMSKKDVIQRMMFSAPYVSWLLNPSWRHRHHAVAKRHGAWTPPFPAPQETKLYAG